MNHLLVVAVGLLASAIPVVAAWVRYRKRRSSGTEEQAMHARRSFVALIAGGGIPFVTLLIALGTGFLLVATPATALVFFARLALLVAVLVLASTIASVIAGAMPEHWASDYIDLAARACLLTTSAFTVGVLLTENGIDLTSWLSAFLTSLGIMNG